MFERHASVASETSFANAGVIAPGYVTPWAAPGMPLKVLRHCSAGTRRCASAGATRWASCRGCGAGGAPAARRCTRPTAPRMYQLAHYSSQRLHALTAGAGPGVRAGARRAGAAAQRARPGPGPGRAAHAGRAAGRLRAARRGPVPPARTRAEHRRCRCSAGISLPQDEVGNCRQFAHLLKAAGAAPRRALPVPARGAVAGARAPPPVVRRPRPLGQRQRRWRPLRRRAAVHRPSGATRCCEPLGLSLPLAPVYGYSMTAPLRQANDHARHWARAAP